MKNAVLIINNRFIVNIELSELLDNITKEKIRLEPRLMKLLYMLMEQQGKVVKREFIIKEIWDDYPGANEGLNQAISFLRKLLVDDNKAIIQTQPKSGYSFHASVLPVNENKTLLSKKYVLMIIGAIFSVLLFIIIIIYLHKTPSDVTKGQLNESNGVEISRHDSIHQAKQQRRFPKDTLGKAAKGDSVRF